MDKANRDTLETQVLRLYELMQKMRADLAVLTDSDADKPVLDTAADQLMTIASDSERASENILDANDKIVAVAEGMMREIKYSGAQLKFQEVLGACVKIKIASNVQEAASMRISNVIQTINLVEGTLNSLVVKVGNGSVTGVETALSGIHMMEEADSAETITMRSHKRPKKNALEKQVEDQ